MQPAQTTLEYASERQEVGGDRLLRRIVAWSTIVYAGTSVAGFALHAALAKGWIASPKNTSYGFGDDWNIAAMVISAAAMCAALAGGTMLLARARASLVLIRAGFAVVLAVSVWGYARFMTGPYAEFTPAAAANHVFGLVNIAWPPVVMVLFTLPPLARRMV